jgi:ERCC4-type nuclease
MIRKWDPRNVEILLYKFFLKYGTYVMKSPSPTHTAHYIRALAAFEQKEKRHKIGAIRIRERTMTIEDKKRYLMEGLVGPSLALKLLEKFNWKPIDIFNADPLDLYDIDGVGPVTVSNIMEILGRK